MPATVDQSRSGSLKMLLTGEIRTRIAGGAMPLGAQISDKALAAELRVSRTPVREALLALAAEGLVTVRPQHGTFVFAPDPAEVNELCTVRAVMEIAALRLADATELTPTLTLILTRSERALAARDFIAFEALDTQFHEAIVEASANRYLSAAYRGIADKISALRHRMPRSNDRFARAVNAHRAIIASIAAGKIEEATVILGDHVRQVETLLTA